jgi:hypothetical protein
MGLSPLHVGLLNCQNLVFGQLSIVGVHILFDLQTDLLHLLSGDRNVADLVIS